MIPRLLSYPPRHDYVDRLAPDAATLVHPDEPWPALPSFYDPAWLADHHLEWDVAHLHFTWEQYPARRVAEVLATHRESGTPLVWTAHDLRNPHTADAAADDTYLSLLAGAADRVITLTAGAASEVSSRFGRDAQVIPHGPLLAAETAAAMRAHRVPRRGPPRLLVHGKSLRASLDWEAVVAATGDLVKQGVSLQLDVLVHDDVAAAVEGRAGGVAGVRVRPHQPLTLAELCGELVAADALVLPYRWGTHSGLLELAADVGVPVIAADVGYLREQGQGIFYEPGADGLLRALRGFATDPPAVPPVPPEEREWGRRQFVEAHRAIYDEVAGAPGNARPRARAKSSLEGSPTTIRSSSVQST